MDTKLFLAISAVIALLYGIAFILIPNVLLSAYGVQSNPSAVLGFRYFGVTLLGLGLITWLVRESRDWTALRGVLIGLAVGDAVGTVLSIWATLAGLMNGMGWSAVLIYLILLVGCVYCLSVGGSKVAAS